LFGITRQAYYQKLHREAVRNNENAIILEMVRQIRREHPRMGCRKLLYKIRPMLAQENLKMGRDRLFSLLREADLLVKCQRKFRKTTISGFFRAPNRLSGLVISRCDQVWVCDITYLELMGNRFAYLFLLMDLFSRYIVGWHVSSSLATEGALTALQMALSQTSSSLSGLIHHSDHGVQYTSQRYVNALLDNEILTSMGAIGNCYDNVYAERVIGTLKREYLLDSPFADLRQVTTLVEEVIYLYNSGRPHLSLGYATPNSIYDQDVIEITPIHIPQAVA